MSDQDENEGGQSGDGGDKTTARDERRRGALTKRAETAEANASDLQSKVDAQADEIAELQGKSGGIDKMVERLQGKLTKAEGERDAALGQVEGLRSGSRTSSLVAQLADAHDMPASRIKGQLLGLKADDSSLDIAPEHIDEKLVDSFSSLLKKSDPGLFTQSSETGKPRTSRPGPAPAAHERGLSPDERRTAQDREKFIANDPLFQQPADGRMV